MKSALSKKRKDFVDIAKGFTILLVVIEHNSFIFKYHIVAQVIILSFHMPLFYFVSGIFFSSNEDLLVLTKKRFHSLLKPYFSACLLFFLLKAIKNIQSIDITSFIGGVLYGTSSSLSWPYQPLWFLTSLFVTVLFCRILYSCLNRISRGLIRICILFMLLFVGVFCIKHESALPHDGLPWNVDILGITMFFYALGFELRQWLFNINLQKESLVLPFIFFLILFIAMQWFFTIIPNDPYSINLTLRHYDNFFVNSFEAISGILVLVLVSIGISRYSVVVSKVFSYIGRCSLTIFIFHEFFMPYIGDAGKIFLGAGSFSLFAFTISLTVAVTLVVHEIIIHIPGAGFLLLNHRARAGA